MLCDMYRSAYSLLTNHNKNTDLNSPDGLSGGLKRFVKFNGAVSENQIEWLNKVLGQAQSDRELVLVAGLFFAFYFHRYNELDKVAQ